MLLIAFAFTAFLFFYHLYHLWKWRSIWHIKGPVPLPIFGNILSLGSGSSNQFKNINNLIHKYGKEDGIIRMSLGISNHYLVIANPELNEFFLSSPKILTKNCDYKLLQPWMGKGLITSSGSYWQKRRKAITPTFHFKILDQFVPVFNAQSKKLIERLSGEHGAFDIYPYLTAYTLDCICSNTLHVTAMGISVNAQNDPDNEYVQAVNKLINIQMLKAFTVWRFFPFIFQFSNEYQTEKRCLKLIHDFTNSVIKERRKSLLNTTSEDKNSDDDVDVGIKKRQALLDLLLASSIDGVLLSDSAISEEVTTFLFGGHDTTASLISFALYELSRNPEKQEKLYEEIKEIFGTDKERVATINDLNKLKYLAMVLKETLRMYPSVPYFARELEEDFTYNGRTYKKGLTLAFLVYHLHKRPDLFENPEKFEPERFSVENQIKIKSFAYIPFSAGPRNCIGQKFGMLEAKLCLSKIVRNFEIHPTGRNVILSPEIVLKSENGIYVKLKKRI